MSILKPNGNWKRGAFNNALLGIRITFFTFNTILSIKKNNNSKHDMVYRKD